jgi:hypothetical protein
LFVAEANGLSPKSNLNQNITDKLLARGIVKNKPFASNFWKNRHSFKPKNYVAQKIILSKWH